MLKISENNGTEEIGLVTPTPDLLRHVSSTFLYAVSWKNISVCSFQCFPISYSLWSYFDSFYDDTPTYDNLPHIMLVTMDVSKLIFKYDLTHAVLNAVYEI